MVDKFNKIPMIEQSRIVHMSYYKQRTTELYQFKCAGIRSHSITAAKAPNQRLILGKRRSSVVSCKLIFELLLSASLSAMVDARCFLRSPIRFQMPSAN